MSNKRSTTRRVTARASAARKRETAQAASNTRKTIARPTLERARQIVRSSYKSCRRAGHDHALCAGYAALQVEKSGHGRFLKQEHRALPRRGTSAHRSSNPLEDFVNGKVGLDG